MKTYSLSAVRAMVRKAAETDGSLRAYAKRVGCSTPYLSDVLHGRRDPGPKILAPLGLEKIEPRYELRYRKVTP